MATSCHGFLGGGQSDSRRQRLIPVLGEPRKPEPVEDRLILSCESMLDAIHLCIHLSNYSHQHIAAQLGIDNGHWTRMMQGRAHFPPNKLVPLMGLCGNLAPLQYLSHQFGYHIPYSRQMVEMEAA